MFPCYVTNPCPASCHNDFLLLACQPRGIHARGCSNETCLTVVSFVSPLKRDYLLIIRGGAETVVTADQRCQAGYSSAWASPAAGALCGAKVNVSTGLACSSAARLVVNHRPLMYQIKTQNDSNNKRRKAWAVRTRLRPSHSKCSWLVVNWKWTFSLSLRSVVWFIVMLDPRDQP